MTPLQFAAMSPPGVTYAINPFFHEQTVRALCYVRNEELYRAIGGKRFRLSILEGLDNFKENERLGSIHYRQRSSYWDEEVKKGLLRLPSRVPTEPTFLDEQDRPVRRSKDMESTQNYRVNPVLADWVFQPAKGFHALPILRQVIKIFVRDFTTGICMTLVVDTNPDRGDTIRTVKAKLQERLRRKFWNSPLMGGFPIGQQILIFGGKQLEDERHCSEYNIRARSTLHLLLQPPAPVTVGAPAANVAPDAIPSRAPGWWWDPQNRQMVARDGKRFSANSKLDFDAFNEWDRTLRKIIDESDNKNLLGRRTRLKAGADDYDPSSGCCSNPELDENGKCRNNPGRHTDAETGVT